MVRHCVDMDKSHCPLCNTKLQQASKEQLKDELEPNTYATMTSSGGAPIVGKSTGREHTGNRSQKQ